MTFPLPSKQQKRCYSCSDITSLKERVRYLKETQGGNEAVCKLMDELITEELIVKAKKSWQKALVWTP